MIASAGVALFFIPMVANRTALGLGTTGVVAAVIGLSTLASQNRQAAAAVGGLFVLSFVIGWVTVAVQAICRVPCSVANQAGMAGAIAVECAIELIPCFPEEPR